MRYHKPLALTSLIVSLLFGLSASASSANSPGQSAAEPLEGAFVLNEIIIGLNPDALQPVAGRSLQVGKMGTASLDQLNQRYLVRTVEPLFSHISPTDAVAARQGLGDIYKLSVPPGTDIFAMVADYRANPAVEYAEVNRIYEATDIPNDPDFTRQWGLNNTGQTGGRADADIDAPEAWDIATGTTSVLIAIVDTGVDYTHPDLRGGRVRTDIDHDFVNNDEDAMDDHGHGTYVAGIAAADTHNGVGIAGVCRGCRILPVKVLNAEGNGSAQTVAQGIQYASQSGAQIISMSLGFPSNCGCSETVARAINYAFESGSLLIAASGNDSDKQRTSYPASSPRVMAVGASDHQEQEADFSNRDGYLDILAPGKDIYSLDLNGSYRTASGTSAATPFVSGAAGLILSANPQLSNAELWWRLYQSADDFPAANTSASLNPVRSEWPVAAVPADLTFRVFLPSVARMRSIAGRLNAQQALLLTSAGRVFAPVDTCQGEPANCAPGCGAEVARAGSITALQDLSLLRRFRDETLTSSAVGQHWIEMYQRHRLEFATLLAGDEALRNQARSVLDLWLPLIHALVEKDGSGAAVIRDEHIRASRVMIARLHVLSSPTFQQDLQTAAAVVDLAEQFMGQDVREFWKALVKQSQ